MKTGYYTFYVTCDKESCNGWQYRSAGTFEAVDEDKAVLYAKKEGWHLGDEDLCPQCAREKE